MILITGGAGFIGSHLAERLCDEYDVVIVDNVNTGNLDNLKEFEDKIMLHKMSILDDLKPILKDVEVIFHLAAQINVRKSIEDPFFDLDVNAKGTLNLLEASYDRVEGIIFASSGGAVYGEPKYFPVDERHPTDPISPYGISKLAAEKYLYYYNFTFGIKTCSLRYANVYGPRQDPKGEAGVISIFLDNLFCGRDLIVNGDGSQTRDFLYVDDVVDANLSALKNCDGVYNIGTGKETSINEIIEIILQISGRKINTRHKDPIEGEVKRIYLDINKAREKLGWIPKTEIKEGIKKLYDSIK